MGSRMFILDWLRGVYLIQTRFSLFMSPVLGSCSGNVRMISTRATAKCECRILFLNYADCFAYLTPSNGTSIRQRQIWAGLNWYHSVRNMSWINIQFKCRK